MGLYRGKAVVWLCVVCAIIPSYSVADIFDQLDQETSVEAATEDAGREEFEQYLKTHQSEYESYKKKLAEEFSEYKKISQQESDKYQKQVAAIWESPELSSKKIWVEYSEDLRVKRRVDFESQTISISTTVPKGAGFSDDQIKGQLKGLLKKNQAEAFRDDVVAQAVEKRSKAALSTLKTGEVKSTPILLPLVSDNKTPSDSDVDAIVDNMVKEKTEDVTTNKKGEAVITIKVPLSKPLNNGRADLPVDEKKARKMAELRVNGIPRAARDIASDVASYARKAKLDESLVYAIIETESAFNPMAKSPVPAFGLMQIVPGSAGMDATEQLFGQAKILSPSYLYTRDKNIEVGSTYLNILYYRYLKGIEDPTSRLYCSIAAYNTGAGNVAKAFTGKRKLKPALSKINAMSPQQVYDHLIQHLPYEETQNYLKKVVSRMPKYAI